MKAAVVGENGVEIRDLSKPEPKPNEVLIRVRASSLNRADVGVAAGHQHGRVGGVGSRIGLECSGEIEAVGSEVKDFKPGDRVMGAAPRGYAEYATADQGRVNRIPANNMTYEQAACLPVALQTLHNAIVTAGRFKRGESLLIQGASSGVGLMGLQIGKYLGASIVMGTSTNPGRRGRLGGAKGEFNFDLHAMKRVDYIGVTNRTRTQAELNEVTRLMRADLWPAVEAGKLSLPIDKTFPLDKVADALAMMRANQHFGKIVLVV